jgi:Dolichyl-phosphate-mannose-protein mannosyltransferase
MRASADQIQGSRLGPETHVIQGAVVRMERLVERLASSRLLVLGMFTAVYLPLTVWLAAHKLFWDDEFFTLYISAGEWRDIIAALQTGADQHPPSFYLLTHMFTSLFGATHVTVRAVSMFGFWLMSVCLYAIGRRFLTPAWSAVLLILPCATGAYYYYASEARGYGLMCGFTAVAILCWIKASAGERRSVTVLGLFLSLAGAVACHYYAIFILGPLALAEAVRLFVRRRVDLPIWAAFCGAFVPPLAFFSIIRSAQGYSTHFWAKPEWLLTLTAYSHAFVVFALFIGAAFAISGMNFTGPLPRPIAPWIIACFVTTALLPFAIMIVAKLITHAFIDRYALGSVIGILPIVCYALARLTSERAAAAAAIVVLEVMFFGINYVTMSRRFGAEIHSSRSAYRTLSRQSAGGPVAISEVTIFHRLSFYGPIEFARRISYLADAEKETHYLGFDTVDRGLLDLRPWFPLNTQPFASYLRENGAFLVFGYEGEWTWLTYELPKMGEMRLRSRLGARTLLDFAGDPTRISTLTPAPRLEPTLLERMKNERGSVCRAYLTPASCPDLVSGNDHRSESAVQ